MEIAFVEIITVYMSTERVCKLF